MRGKMSKKFSITTIDLNKINKEITYYKNKNNNGLDPYIFMSDETVSAIESELGVYNWTIDNEALADKLNNTSKVYGTYTGYKLFINNDLKFGVVEIR